MSFPSRLAWFVFLIIACPHPLFEAFAQFSLMHEFAGGDDDGRWPRDRLLLSGSALFGTTDRGGDANRGTVFSIGTNGDNYRMLHEFAGYDGAFPANGLTFDGQTLFGTTTRGGGGDLGVVFSIDTIGGGYTMLRELDGSSHAGLVLEGTTLFGTTYWGGDHNLGSIFSINTNGSDFRLLHSFAGGVDDGKSPFARLTLFGSKLLGTTYAGGDHDLGTVFSINIDGGDFKLIHEFAGRSNNDGSNPSGDLAISGSTLFGTTCGHGEDKLGTVYSIDIDGTNFRRLHSFSGGAADGRCPWDGLTLVGSRLFGTTQFGGDACTLQEWGCGTIYALNSDGTGFALLHEFAGGSADGWRPAAGVTPSGSTLFGTTWRGGDSDFGTVFSLVVPEPSGARLVGIPGILLLFVHGTICRLRAVAARKAFSG